MQMLCPLTYSTKDLNVLDKLIAKAVSFHIKVVSNLKIQPEPRCILKETPQPQRSIGSNRALAVNDLIDASGGYTKPFRQPVLGEL